MKYLKSYENVNIKSYWLIPTDERFEQSLKDIGVPQKVINNHFTPGIKNAYPKYIFVGHRTHKYINSQSEGWGFNMPQKNNYQSEAWYESENYKFMGNINIPDYELATLKYNL